MICPRPGLQVVTRYTSCTRMEYHLQYSSTLYTHKISQNSTTVNAVTLHYIKVIQSGLKSKTAKPLVQLMQQIYICININLICEIRIQLTQISAGSIISTSLTIMPPSSKTCETIKNLSLSVLMAIFRMDLGQPVPEGLHSGFYELQMTEVVVTTGAVRRAKLQIIIKNK